jgi:hypothetical protein
MTSRRRHALGRTLTGLCAASLLLTSLSGCGSRPKVEVSADTSCEVFRHIGANDAQIGVFRDNWTVMESYADQIIAHNMEYDKRCTSPGGAAP